MNRNSQNINNMNILNNVIPNQQINNQEHPIPNNPPNDINNNNVIPVEDKKKIEISPDDIYNKNEVENMLELLKCSICLNILLAPVQCNKCNNCFCKLCIEHYQDSKIKCPFRCENPSYLENKFVKNVLSILKFKCKNGCDKIIKYDDPEKHYEEDCEKIDYKAKYEELLKKHKKLITDYGIIESKAHNYYNILLRCKRKIMIIERNKNIISDRNKK